jgi:hypothetical protein
MIALRYAIAMSAVLTFTGASPAAAQTGNAGPHSFRSSFETSFRTNFTKDCVQSAKESAAGHFGEGSLVNFCECSFDGTLKGLTTIDLLKLYFAGKMPTAADAKLDKVLETCAWESLSDRPKSR